VSANSWIDLVPLLIMCEGCGAERSEAQKKTQRALAR